MKYAIDGNQICITWDDFVNLQESPAIFIPLASETGRKLIKRGFLGLPLLELRTLQNKLRRAENDQESRKLKEIAVITAELESLKKRLEELTK